MEDLKVIVEKVADLMDKIKTNNEANVNGNKAAGRRARKYSVELGKLLPEFRKVSVAANK